MVNHSGHLLLKELHSTGETIVWRDPGGSWACLPPVYNCSQLATVCDKCGLCPKQHTRKRGAPGNTKKTKQHIKKREALWNTRKIKITRRSGTWVEEVYEKDPKGSIQNERSPRKHKKDQIHKKKSWDLGRRSVWKRPKKQAFRMKGEMLNREKPLSNNNSWAEEGQRKSPKMKHSNQKGAL